VRRMPVHQLQRRRVVAFRMAMAAAVTGLQRCGDGAAAGARLGLGRV
jgi:hypothetical protein